MTAKNSTKLLIFSVLFTTCYFQNLLCQHYVEPLPCHGIASLFSVDICRSVTIKSEIMINNYCHHSVNAYNQDLSEVSIPMPTLIEQDNVQSTDCDPIIILLSNYI